MTRPRKYTPPLDKTISLQLITRAKSHLVEEPPLAEKGLRRDGDKWIQTTTVHSLEGIGRVVVGLSADISIMEGGVLRDCVYQ